MFAVCILTLQQTFTTLYSNYVYCIYWMWKAMEIFMGQHGIFLLELGKGVENSYYHVTL